MDEPTHDEVMFSFVCPVFNEQEGLEHFYQRLKAVAEQIGERYEILFVNDGSTDRSAEILRTLAERDGAVKVVDFSRNFGHQAAVTAGYDYAAGRAVVTLDSDCQHPPEMIPKLIEKWQGGAEVVYTVRQGTKGIGGLRRWVGRCVYRIIFRAGGIDVVDQADFRLLDRKAVDAVRGLREHARFVRGLVRWIGFRQAAVSYTAESRHAGTSGYSLRQLARMGFAGLLNFSLAPIRLVGLAGAALLGGGLLYVLIAGVLALSGRAAFSGVVALLLTLTGVQLLALAAVGEYVGRIYEEAKGRPLYLVRHLQGFESKEDLASPEAPTPSREGSPRFSVMT